MVGGCLSCFFTYTSVLLLWLCLQDVQTSSCDRDIHKKIGDTVELSSCSPAEGVTMAQWKYEGSLIAAKSILPVNSQFKGRLELNATSFHLTVRRLTLQDSGKFSFISEVNDKQRKTVTITLHVHEPITIGPTVTYNSSWHASTNSCTVWLDCSASAGSSVTYSWAVRNQTSPGLQGSRRHYNISPQDGDTRFTCFISNVVTEKSASVTVKCSSDPRDSVYYFLALVLLIVGLVIGLSLFILLLLCYTKSKGPCFNRVAQSQTVNPDEQHVYSSLLHGDGSVYETMRGFEDAATVVPSDLDPASSKRGAP